MKEISDSEVIQVFRDLHDHLLTRRRNPAYMRLDNEASPSFQRELKSKDIDFQLAPPGMHFHNTEERAISIFKDHFIAGFFSPDP